MRAEEFSGLIVLSHHPAYVGSTLENARAFKNKGLGIFFGKKHPEKGQKVLNSGYPKILLTKGNEIKFCNLPFLIQM